MASSLVNHKFRKDKANVMFCAVAPARSTVLDTLRAGKKHLFVMNEQINPAASTLWELDLFGGRLDWSFREERKMGSVFTHLTGTSR